MPIVGLVCGHHAEAVGPGHFAPMGECLYVHYALADRVMHSQSGRPAGWSVTEVMGCLRKTAILKTLDVVVDPQAFVAMEVGTAWHDRMGSNGTRWTGELAGLPLSGAPDEFSAGETIGDHKHSYSSPPRGGGVWSSHQVQVSMYNLLAVQGGLPPFKRGVIWYAGKWGQEGRECELLQEDAILGYKINPEWTIANNMSLGIGWDRRHPAMTDDGALSLLPLTGKVTPFGKKVACDYCAVRRDCERLES